MKIKTLLVDDEYLALQLLEQFIRQIPDLEIVDKVKSPIKALEILNHKEIDLLFLDIQMPSLSGNKLLKTLQYPPPTIFTTAYEDYAIEAFELNAVDYLLKPFSFERFLQAVNKAREQLKLRHNTFSSTEVNKVKEADFFSIKVDGRMMKVNYDDILFVEGFKEYVRIVCKDKKLITLERMKNMEQKLSQKGFLRVHKSYLVAKNKVQSMEGNLLEIDSHKIPVSRSKREEIMKAIFG